MVAISWAGHRDLFALIRRTDRLLVWLNVLYLLPLCIIPFGASMLARYEDAAIALQMCRALLLAVAATRLGIWWYATGRSHLLYEPIDAPSRRAGVSDRRGPAAAYLGGHPRRGAGSAGQSPDLLPWSRPRTSCSCGGSATPASPDAAERDFT